MCYFGPPPVGVKNRNTGNIEYLSVISTITHKELAKLEEPEVGFYAMQATGFHYKYYDGESWYMAHNPNDKYEFIYPVHNHSEILHDIFQTTELPKSQTPEFPLDLLNLNDQ